MDLTELRNKVKELNDERTRIVREQGQAALAGAFAEVFEKYPQLESVTWTQYTPHFNDGDACVFCVREFHAAKYDGKEHEEPAWDWKSNELPKPLIKDLSEIQKATQGLGDTMELIFGDHVEVTARRGAFDVEEYDHD
jgi:hypothetical protein